MCYQCELDVFSRPTKSATPSSREQSRRGIVAEVMTNERPQLNFSGHETFAVRYGWLKKVFDAFEALDGHPNKIREVFTSDDAIANFGVGKNMVASMRHWALACGVLAETEEGLRLTRFAKFLFADRSGRDPYLDHPASVWLLHWRIATNLSLSTTWYYAFNHFARNSFEKSQLVSGVMDFARVNGVGKRSAENTFERDVDCFVSSYVQKSGKRSELLEDSMECPLTELGLIRATAQKGLYSFDIGPKPNLESAVFFFAVDEFLKPLPSKTASLEQLTHDPGSPGRVFKLTENEVAGYLMGVEEASDGNVVWRDSAGLQQVQLRGSPSKPFEFLAPVYRRRKFAREAAE